MTINISSFFNNSIKARVISGLGGVVVGGLASYIPTLMHRKPVMKIVPAEPTEHQQPESYYDPELERMLDEEALIAKEAEEELEVVEEQKLVNIFTVPDGEWDMEYELEQRSPNAPYVIHADEYLEGEFGYKQETVTYYDGDDIMATMADVPIYNWASMMGDLKWGHGSKDKSVVYIRNEDMSREWEVLLHHGSFEIETQGLHIEGGELQHSHRVPKFRDL
jgi:hypothetical protein